MVAKKVRIFLLIFLWGVLSAPTCLAQEKNQLAVSFGRTYVNHQTVPGTSFLGNSVAFGEGGTIEGNYSRILKQRDSITLSVEFPIIINLDQDLNYGQNVIPESYQAYFVTPSAHITFAPALPINPWVSVGGGFGHFTSSSKLEFGGSNPGKTGSTSGVIKFGGGIDVRTWRSFSVRGEFREFYSGVPQLNVNTGKTRQNNLFVGVGVVWNFDRF
jgi:hypothetical protein